MSQHSTSEPSGDTSAPLQIALQSLAARLGKTPTVVDMHKDGDHHPEAYVEAFGSWEAALEAAGLDPDEMGAKKIPDVELLAELQRLAKELDRTPSQQDMKKHGDYSDQTYKSRFGSWNDALQQAMLDTNTVSDQRSKDELLHELRRLSQEVGRIPTAGDMENHGEYGHVTYHRRFGSWRDALDEAGLLQ